jgi:hypothetical protein
VRVGWISGTTAALHAALRPADESAPGDAAAARAVTGLAVVDSEGFSLMLSRRGEPVVFRQKNFTEGLADADRARLLTAELKLTRTFLEERLPGTRIGALFLSAPRAVEPFWLQVLGEGLGTTPIRLRGEHVGVDGVESLDGAPGAGLLALAASWAREL